MIKKYVTLFTLIMALSTCITSAHAQSADVKKGNWLLGIIFKLERMRDNAIDDIQKYENAIKTCNATIGKGERLVRLAQEKGNTKVEKMAKSALTKATQAKLKNEELKGSAGLRKKRAEVALANVRNHVSTNTDIQSVMTRHTGRVDIFSKKRNESITLDNDRAAFLEPGDEIWTHGNSSVEMQFLGGRGTLKLGEYSKFKMEKDTQGTQIIHMIKGKISISVEKLDKYKKMMNDKIKQYQSDATLVKDEVVEKLLEEHKNLPKRIKKNTGGGFYVKTPTAVLAIRGTKFLLFEDDKAGTKLVVTEGVVEVKAINGEKKFIVNAGHEIHVAKDGVVSGPEKIDLKKMKNGK